MVVEHIVTPKAIPKGHPHNYIVTLKGAPLTSQNKHLVVYREDLASLIPQQLTWTRTFRGSWFGLGPEPQVPAVKRVEGNSAVNL